LRRYVSSALPRKSATYAATHTHTYTHIHTHTHTHIHGHRLLEVRSGDLSASKHQHTHKHIHRTRSTHCTLTRHTYTHRPVHTDTRAQPSWCNSSCRRCLSSAGSWAARRPLTSSPTRVRFLCESVCVWFKCFPSAFGCVYVCVCLCVCVCL